MARAATKAREVERQTVTEGMRFANGAVTIEAAPPALRVSLRATPKGMKVYEKKLGFALPMKPGETKSRAGKHALCLGPDEWLIISVKGEGTNAKLHRTTAEYAETDVSHRNTAFILTGMGAENTINAGCPRDLSLPAFPVGTASRTIFGKAEIVLYRTAKDTFRLECWRSFAPYVWAYLLDGAKDAHI